jgi:hypothetical protein
MCQNFFEDGHTQSGRICRPHSRNLTEGCGLIAAQKLAAGPFWKQRKLGASQRDIRKYQTASNDSINILRNLSKLWKFIAIESIN